MIVKRKKLMEDLEISIKELEESIRNLRKTINTKEMYERRKKMKAARKLLIDYLYHLSTLTEDTVEIEDPT